MRPTDSSPVSETALRLLIVDDDPLVRDALRTAMDAAGGVLITGEVADAEAALAALSACRPQVVLLDGEMPGADTGTITRRLRERDPNVQIVVFTNEDDEERGIRGLRAGAVGVLGKGVTNDALVRSLQGVVRGEAAVSRALALKIVQHLRDAPDAGRGMRPVWSPLTSREWEVLDLICAGCTTDQIAVELGLVSETVRGHVKRVLAKLGASSREEAAAIGERLRAVDGDWSQPPVGGEPGR